MFETGNAEYGNAEYEFDLYVVNSLIPFKPKVHFSINELRHRHTILLRKLNFLLLLEVNKLMVTRNTLKKVRLCLKLLHLVV